MKKFCQEYRDLAYQKLLRGAVACKPLQGVWKAADLSTMEIALQI